MIKVAVFIESLAAGGAEKVLTLLAENINKDIFDLTVISETSGQLYCSRVESACKLKTFAKNCDKSDFFQYNLNRIIYRFINTLPRKLLHRLIIGKGYDIEIAFCEGFATRLIACSSNRNSKKIAFVHTDFATNHWSKIHYKNFEEEKKAYQKFNSISCVSCSVSESFIKLFGLKESVMVNYNPIDSEKIKFLAEEKIWAKASYGLRFISIGRLVEVKGYMRLIRIARELLDESYDFELMILGYGELGEALRNYIDENSLSEKIKLHGFADNPYPYLKASDCFICSSYAEGFSTAIAESIVLDLPVISTDCAGVAEAFGDESCGIICENTDKALKDAIKTVLENPSLLDDFKLACKNRSDFFSLKAGVEKIEKMLIKSMDS